MRNFPGAVVFTLMAWLVGAAASSAATSDTISPEQAAIAILDYYPARAQAGHVEGVALLRCHENTHARLEDCVLSGESPTGFGFGEAALKLAKLSVDNPAVTKAPQPAGGLVQFTFRLNPQSIEPNPLLPLTHPLWTTGPDFRKIPNFASMIYPAAAARSHIMGRVALDCIVSSAGAIKSCVASEEAPIGYGFGQAAIDFVKTFSMNPALIDGQPQDGAHILIPMSFKQRN